MDDKKRRQPRVRCTGEEARRRGVGAPWESRASAQEVAARLESVRIPPQYPEATLCMDPASRVQAWGRDARGRLQVLYHDAEVARRQERKVQDVLRLCRARTELIPTLRRDALRGAPLGLAAWILAESAARPGHPRYQEQHGTRGIASLACEHVEPGVRVEVRFPAKHGKTFATEIQDPEVADVLRERFRTHCRSSRRAAFWGTDVDADELNAYLEDILPGLRAKHIRTWRANVHFLAAWEAAVRGGQEGDRAIQSAVRATAAHLQNTPAVARKQYLLEPVLEAVERAPAQTLAALASAASPSDVLGALLGEK